MKLNRLGSAINRENRAKLNENMSIIENDFNEMNVDVKGYKETVEENSRLVNQANLNASEALILSNAIQDELDSIVVEGDSSVEAAQARTNSDTGKTYINLRARLDDENEVLTQKSEKNALLTSSFPRLANETNDSPRLARAVAALPKGYKLLLTEDVIINSTLTFDDKESCEFDSLGKKITPLTSLLFMVSIRNSPHFKMTKKITLNGLETAKRGIEVIRSPFTIIESIIENIGNLNEEESTCGILVKEFSDFTIIRSIISKVYAKYVASGVWIGNFSEEQNPNALSKDVLVDKSHISDIYPIEDADGVKILNGEYNGNVNLIVQNSTFINCRKRGLKFQAKGCKSINNYIEFTEPSAYAAIDWQRGDGSSTNDTVVSNVPNTFTSGHFYYTAFHVGASNIKINGAEVKIASENPNLNLASRILQVGDLVGEDIKNVSLINSVLDGHYIELLVGVDGLTITGNKMNIRGGRALHMTSNLLLPNINWRDNEIVFAGSTSGDVLSDYFSPTSGYVSQILSDGTERYIRPKTRNAKTEWHIRLAESASPMNYDIVNDRCVTSVSSNPQTANNSRFNALFNWCKVGDTAYKVIPTTGSNNIGNFVSDRWVCTQAADATNVRGLWEERKFYI